MNCFFIKPMVLVALTLSLAQLQADVPQMIHYQGYVTVSGEPFTGQGLFKFALVDRAGTNTYWSHDGTSVGGAAPSTIITNIAVFKGLYSVLLGDQSINGMTRVIPTTVFADHRDVFLRVWFDDGTNGLQQLAPDTRIASVGFAMVAEAVCDGAIDSAALAPNITLGGSSTSGTLTLKSGGDQLRAILDAGLQNISPSFMLFDLTGTFDAARIVASEFLTGGAQLLLRNGAGKTTVELDAQDGSSTNAGGYLRLLRSDGKTVVSLESELDNGNSGLLLYDFTGTKETVRLTGSEGGMQGGLLSLRNTNANPTIQLRAQDTSDPTSPSVLQMNQNNGRQTVTLRAGLIPGALGGGSLSLGNSAGNTTVDLTGDGGENQGRLILKHSDLANRVRIDADGPNDSGELKLYDSDGTETIQLLGAQGADKGAVINMHDGDGTTTITLDADDANEGAQVELKKGNGTTTLTLAADDDWDGGRIELNRGSGARTVRLTGDLDGDGKGALQLFKGDGVTETVRLTGSYQGTGGGFAHFKDSSGNITVQINGDDNGEGKITTEVLQITGGSDLSERFEVSAKPATPVEPGLIVCIDPDRPGELRVSDRAYDSTVAGVISGAGGVKPGMLMGQRGTKADGRHPVALTGRVYCYVDADFGAVKPGDLITTSGTPGHGMKAEPGQAAGAIIGKAMTSLAHGQGLVLVLVSLQ
jgi:hypothetical protein